MKRRALFFVCLLVGGVTVASDSAEESDEPLSLETILNSTVGKDEYVDVTKCLSRHKIREVKVLDEKHVVFRIGRDKYYLVQMKHRCPGLARDSKISYETGVARLCTRDSIRGVIEIGASMTLGPRCHIPSFQEITREQLVLIKDALRNKK